MPKGLSITFSITRPCALGAVLLSALLLPACGEEPKPPPPPPPPPPPVQGPVAVEIDAIMQSTPHDARVQFPSAFAPTDESLARAVIALADALAKGDGQQLRPLLDPQDHGVLESLSASGDWETATKPIEAVRVVGLKSAGVSAKDIFSDAAAQGAPDVHELTLALQEPGGAYAVAWYAAKAGDHWIFTGAPAPSGTRARATQWEAGAAGDEPTPGPAAAAPGGDADEKAVLGYLMTDLSAQMGKAIDPSITDEKIEASFAAAGKGEEMKAARAAGQEALARGAMPSDEKIAQAVGRLRKGLDRDGKISAERYAGFLAQILNIPQERAAQIMALPQAAGGA